MRTQLDRSGKEGTVDGGATEMAIGYRSILRLPDTQDAIDLAERHIWEWIKGKAKSSPDANIPEDLYESKIYSITESITLHVVHSDDTRDGSRRRLFRLVEKNITGTWIVSVYAGSFERSKTHFKQSLVIEVDQVDKSYDDAVVGVSPPRLVRALLEEVTATDGSTELTGLPSIIRTGETSEVLEAILDPERTATVIVAVSIGQETDSKWREAVQNLTTESVGVSATYVIFADAVPEFNNQLPPSHMVKPGRVRTFAPGVDLNDPADSARHLWLGPITFTRALHYTKNGQVRVHELLKRSHAEPARRRFLERDLPADISRMMDLLKRREVTVDRRARVKIRLENSDLRGDRLARPLYEMPAVPETPSLHDNAIFDRLSQLLEEWVGASDISVSTLDSLDEVLKSQRAEVDVAAEQLDEAADTDVRRVSSLRSARERIDDLEVDLAISEERVIDCEIEIGSYRQRLIKSNRAEETYITPPDDTWQHPESLQELVARITPGENSHPASKYVEFSGNESYAAEVDRRYPSSLYAKTFWVYVRILYDYACRRVEDNFPGNVHSYLVTDTVDGTKCSKDRHASKESSTVMSRKEWSDARSFPVPFDVEKSGYVHMYAHFKPPHRDRFAPRMHYYDDTNNVVNPRIYIGYIGRHLRTKNS